MPGTTNEDTFLIGCPTCGDIYRWRSGPNGMECLGELTKEETLALTLRKGRAGNYGWECLDCQKKRSEGKT
jgi:RNase P subunit RPR2